METAPDAPGSLVHRAIGPYRWRLGMAHQHLSDQEQYFVMRFRQVGNPIDYSTWEETGLIRIQRSIPELQKLDEAAKACPQCNARIVELLEDLWRAAGYRHPPEG